MNNKMQNENRIRLVIKLLSIVLTCALAITLTACNFGQTPNNNHDSETTNNISDDINQNENDKSLFKSDLMKNLLKNPEYISLIRTAQRYPSEYQSPKFDPHPYAFLEEEGHNIEAIKNGELYCATQSFVLPDEPNSLYIATYVQCFGDYYEHYMLKYHLTDEEMKDYDYAHRHGSQEFYVEAVFLNNEISKTRDPISIDNTKVSTEAHKELQTTFKQLIALQNFNANHFFVLLKEYSVEDQTFSVYVMPNQKSLNTMKSSSAKFGCFDCYRGLSKVEVENGIYCSPSNSIRFKLVEGTIESGVTTATYYHPQDTELDIRAAKTNIN